MAKIPFQIKPVQLLNDLEELTQATPIHNATWYRARQIKSGLGYEFAAGTLAAAQYLTLDLLCSGPEAGAFVLELQEGEDGPTFQYLFAALPQASARLRVPLAAVRQNRWMYPREGALLKPRVSGQRVNLGRVNRMRVLVNMMGAGPVEWCMTPVLATVDEPLELDQPVLPNGPLIDELGQSIQRQWEGKSASAEEVTSRLQSQLEAAPQQTWPEGFSTWGGWTGKQFEASGFFRTEWDGSRWWLVDPDGYVFWSAGQDCVAPNVSANITHMESALSWIPGEDDPLREIIYERNSELDVKFIDHLQANFIRAFGTEDWYAKWVEITLAELKRDGFNTVANWSDWRAARHAGFPYVRPLNIHNASRVQRIYRELPDVFAREFEAEAAEFASQLTETRDDPAMIGYFMMNEPTWGFAQETPAVGMLLNTTKCASRQALSDFLRERYGDDDGLSAAWGQEVIGAEVAEGEWTTPLSQTALDDLADFSAILVGRYFGMLSKACKKVDPNHLNLGIRYHTVPPQWALDGMRSFDVFSINCYKEQVPADDLKAIHELLNMPTMIGEWHMGALDVGLPATGVGPRVIDQEARAQAYRFYLENAAAIPHCVGVHHFTHYDQSALGRFDGEAYNIGFYDICNRPYEVLVQAAREAHARMYAVALGEAEPYSAAPEFLPRFFY
ncbi:MAG: hypothetical protein K8L99_18845 [Anaerolineae bacterium]|nr:hypothetical protein [Anaerolineae bacterium]